MTASSDAFEAWFAGSHAVDRDGAPLRLYHGTAAVFDRFDTPRIYLTDEPAEASGFADARAGGRSGCGALVLPVYARIIDPYVLRPGDSVLGDFFERVRLAGHDGVIGAYRAGREFIVFDNAQIACAIGGPARARVPEEVPPAQRDEFRAWFGRSAAADAEGRPLMLFHGTASSFDRFRPSADGGIYTTTRREEAEEFGMLQGARQDALVIALYASIQRPREIDLQGEVVTERTKARLAREIARAKAKGHDGLVVRNVDNFGMDVSDSFVVFEDRQLRKVRDWRMAAELGGLQRAAPDRMASSAPRMVRLGR